MVRQPARFHTTLRSFARLAGDLTWNGFPFPREATADGIRRDRTIFDAPRMIPYFYEQELAVAIFFGTNFVNR